MAQASEAQATFRLDGFLPYRLMVAAERVSLGFSEIYKSRYGISRPEWRVLASLAELRRATAKQIGGHSSMHKTKVSRAVFELEKRKWLRRETDPGDRRVEHLELTRTGRQVHGKLVVEAQRYQDWLVQQLGSDKGADLLAILRKLEVVANREERRD
jgi:DNA-binding MarR family transcriptional regulator